MTVEDATECELSEMDERLPGISSSSLAALALALARGIDEEFSSLTAKANAAGQLRGALSDLRELLPPRRESDGIDDIARRRAERQAAAGG